MSARSAPNGAQRATGSGATVFARALKLPGRLTVVAIFFACLAALLAGYMFMGRGFAHLGFPPVYVGEIVLAIGVGATAIALGRSGARIALTPTLALLVGFMALGAARTVPYLATYGIDALRDAVLWGYAAFAIIIYALANRTLAVGALRVYGWIVPAFAVWLPIAFNVFVVLSASIQPDELGSNVPLVFFKSGDMSVHVVGAIAFLVLGAGGLSGITTFAWRAAIAVPLLWTAFIAGATNRGGLLAVVSGLVVVAMLAVALKRSRNWLPIITAPVGLAVVFAVVAMLGFDRTSPPSGVEPAPSRAGGPAVTRQAGAPTAQLPPSTTCEAASQARSLVENPGFEHGDPNAGIIDGWATWAGVYHIVEGDSHLGARYASIENTGEPWTATITSSRFAFEAGQRLAVSLHVKAIVGRPVLATYINWYDAAGARIASVRVHETNTDLTWQESTGTLTAPPGTTHADVQMYEAAGRATVGVDEVIVQPATATCEVAPASRSLVVNPGFELGTTNVGTIDGWTTWAGMYNVVEGDSHRGARYASIENTGEAWTANMTSTRFPIDGGEDISVTFSAKAIEGSPAIAAYVNWYDASGSPIASVEIASLDTMGEREWQRTREALSAPGATAQADVQLYETTGKATVGIDEVIVESGDFVVVSAQTIDGRSATIGQIVENITSIFSDTGDEGLEGTKRFRLRWWGAIIDYTVFGEYFWTGKGFGINLADADGFQANQDRSLRAPHNSHLTALARMGVPGLVMWVLLQGVFAIGLVRSVLAAHHAGDWRLAAVGGWILAYWVAMMVNTSFDPYLEGPQGGIWFWSLFGLGLVVMRLGRERRKS